jgi:hypothetical protein
VALSSIKEAAIFNIVGAIVSLFVLVIFRVPLADSFGFVILVESTALMLIGGALGVAGQATSRKIAEFMTRRKVTPSEVASGDLKAALYSITGGLLFAEVFVLSMLLA